MSEELVLLSVRELKALEDSVGRPFASVLVIKKLATKTASNGNPFLTLDLGDRTGSFGCTLFSDGAVFDTVKNAGEGGVLRIEGRIDYYQGRLSPKLLKVVPLSEEELAAPGLIDNLVEVAPEPALDLWAEFQTFIDGISHDELRMSAWISDFTNFCPERILPGGCSLAPAGAM